MSQVLGALSPMSMALPSDATSSGAAGIVGTMSTPQSHGYAQIFSQTNSSLQNTIVSSGSSSLETAQTNMNLQTSGNHELGGQSSAMLPPPMIPPGQLPVSITPLSQIPNSFPQTSQPPSVYAAPAHIFTSNQAPAVQSQTQNSSLGGRPLSLPGQSQATPMAPGASTAGGGFGQGSTTQYGTYHPPAVYMAPPMPPSTQMVPPGGAMRYQSPSFSPIIRQPAFPPRPPLGPPPMMSTGRPPIMGGMRPLPLLKPPLGMGHILPLEKPHTTIYVGKIATTIEDEFIRSVLELCGPIKSWKRAQDPTTNSPKRFGFCEYETAEGVLRALRLLNKFSMDGQELVLNVDTTTRDYLERYVSRKKENDKLLKEAAELEKEEETAPGVEVPLAKPAEEKDSEDASGSEEAAKKFGIVNEDDKQGDDTAFEKLKSMLEERAKSKPLPPPPGPPSADLGAKSSEISVKSKDGDSNIDGTRSDDPNARIEDETTSERKSAVDGERMEASSSDRGKRTERDRERDRERDIEREREREIERVEREREKERIRRERERDHRVREAERAYEERSKEWEARERDKERQRLHDKDRDKERERERRRQIKEQEEDTDDEDDDDWRKRRHRQEEKRKRRMREREDDLTDRLKEQQEILEPKRQKLQEVPRKMEMDVDGDSASKTASLQNGAETPKKAFGSASEANKITSAGLSSNGIHEVANDGGTSNKATGDETELKLGQNFIPRKLGFGLIGAGKRTAVLPVFHEEDEEETPKEKRMRPLVPIDYSAEEMEAVNAKSLSAGPSPNLAAAAEFAKSLSGLTPRSPSKDDRRDDFDRRKQKDRSSEKGRYRERERDRERDRDKEKEREREKDRDRERDKGKDRERTKEKDRDREKERTGDKNKPPDNTKILDAKQLIDTIPKTKEELFGYPVDWSIYDKHDLHDRMRPWIAKKITEFLGEEETTLVDYILTNTRKHVTAAGMLEVLEGILDDEAEMFVLKMWRMLIFEIKRIETGLALKQPKG